MKGRSCVRRARGKRDWREGRDVRERHGVWDLREKRELRDMRDESGLFRARLAFLARLARGITWTR